MSKSHHAIDAHVAKIHTAMENESAARSSIVSSWRRSFYKHNIAPDLPRDDYVLTAQEIHQLRNRRDRLIHVARPILEDLFRSVGLSGYTAVLSDRDGVVLDKLANDYDQQDFRQNGLRIGSIWSEECQGTNAIGSVAVDAHPMVVFKDEHFASRIIGLTCIGAPIFDPKGQIIGVLDVTSARSDTTEESAKFLLPIVVNAANRIETEYFRACFDHANIVVANGYSKIGTPLLAADEDDLIIGANRAARRLLDLQDELFESPIPRRDILDMSAGARGLAAAERGAIKRAIARNDGNMSKAAKDLGVSRATFYRMLNKHGLT